MTTSLSFTPAAEIDLAAIFVWYAEQRDGLGGRFIDAADELFRRMRESPRQFPRSLPGVSARTSPPISVWRLLLARAQSGGRSRGPASTSRPGGLAGEVVERLGLTRRSSQRAADGAQLDPGMEPQVGFEFSGSATARAARSNRCAWPRPTSRGRCGAGPESATAAPDRTAPRRQDAP